MDILLTIFWVLVGLTLAVGIVRVMFAPYTGIVNFFMEIMLLDFMFDFLGDVFNSITDIWD